jgi:hypothetical protein
MTKNLSTTIVKRDQLDNKIDNEVITITKIELLERKLISCSGHMIRKTCFNKISKFTDIFHTI